MLSSMEDAVISCSRALSKIIGLYKVDALHISSQRFGEARHSEALAMAESVLEFRRRVLPAEHPDICEGRVWSAAALVPHTHSDIRFNSISLEFVSRAKRRACPCAAGCSRGVAPIACLRPAARNLSALGDEMSSCRSSARKKASSKRSNETFGSFFKAGSSSLRFAFAVSLSPNWIKESFKSHVEPLHIK
jgi:hypothetical protein